MAQPRHAPHHEFHPVFDMKSYAKGEQLEFFGSYNVKVPKRDIATPSAYAGRQARNIGGLINNLDRLVPEAADRKELHTLLSLLHAEWKAVHAAALERERVEQEERPQPRPQPQVTEPGFSERIAAAASPARTGRRPYRDPVANMEFSTSATLGERPALYKAKKAAKSAASKKLREAAKGARGSKPNKGSR